jgi:predicted alpha-1,2-mannosidase
MTPIQKYLRYLSLCLAVVLLLLLSVDVYVALSYTMTKSRQLPFLSSLLPIVSFTVAHSNRTIDYAQYTNTFLGSTGGGNGFPGVVAAPFAMVKLGPDVRNGTQDAYSGYLPDGQIFGFSMTHEHGTGGAPKYGVVSQMPAIGPLSNPLVDLGRNRTVEDSSEVGYYRSQLEGGITIELSASERAGFYQYTFPDQVQKSVVIDVSHVLNSFRGFGWGQQYSGGSFEINSDGYTGHGTYNNGWNLAPDWSIYFCGHFDQPIASVRTFTGNGTELYTYGNSTSTSGTDRQGGVFTFNTTSLSSRVGISFISTSQACSNVETQIPAGTDIKSLVSRAQDRWATEVFSKVSTTETNKTILTQLYSYLYGMHLIPSNRTGENSLWNSTEPSYDDFFTLWDLFRCSTPLWQVLQPKPYEEIIRSLIDIWRHEGFLPDARSSEFTGRTQGGSNAENVLADAYVKGVRGQVNWEDAYEAMKTDAEVVPPNNNGPIAPDSSTKEGRGALPDWLSLGYITPRFSRAVSRAVEYAGNDFGLYQVASGLGKEQDAQKYLNRSRNWRNHWNPRQESLGFSGFVAPRYENGSFQEPYDPLQCGGCYWSGELPATIALLASVTNKEHRSTLSRCTMVLLLQSTPRHLSSDRFGRWCRDFHRPSRKVL